MHITCLVMFAVNLDSLLNVLSIVEITTSSPLGMQLTPLSSHGGIFFRNVTWYPSQNQIGQHLFCFQALDSDG